MGDLISWTLVICATLIGLTRVETNLGMYSIVVPYCSYIAHILLIYCSYIAHILLIYCSYLAQILLIYCRLGSGYYNSWRNFDDILRKWLCLSMSDRVWSNFWNFDETQSQSQQLSSCLNLANTICEVKNVEVFL